MCVCHRTPSSPSPSSPHISLPACFTTYFTTGFSTTPSLDILASTARSQRQASPLLTWHGSREATTAALNLQMPVPVPVYSKPPAHSVHKNHKQAARTDYVRQSVFRHLTNSLPQPPAGLPPSFASREEWISSLPSWRRNKPRRIWEEDARADHRRRGFQEGLTAADNASVIKGAPAQAGIPPISTLFTSADMGASVHRRPATDYEDADDEMSPLDEVMGWQSEDVAHLTDDDDDMGVEQSSESGSFEYAGRYQREVRRTVDLGGEPIVYTRSYERGTFSPVYEERSPGHDSGSSPMAPNTPFGDFVDHAVASQAVGNQPHVTELQYPYTEDYCGAQCYRCQHYVAVEQPVHQAAPVPEPVVTPTATPTYRKLAEPLSEWVSDFVWKVCTTGMSLPPQFVQPTSVFLLQVAVADLLMHFTL